MKVRIPMRRALEDRRIFGDILPGESWASWRVLLIAAMGEELTAAERVVFESLTGRPQEPGERCEELWAIIGRRGGKTRAIAVLASYLAAFVDYSDILAPGERAVLPILSASLWQAGKAHEYICGIFDGVSVLRKLVENRTADSVGLSTRVDIETRPASFRTIRGGTAIAVIADEVSFWKSDDSRNPDKEILAAVRPSLATTHGLLACITSPYASRGETYLTFKRDYGPDGDPKVIIAKAPSKTMNPTLSQSVIDRAYERDPESARSEFGGEFRTDIAAYVDRELIETAVDWGVVVRPPASGVRYRSACDPSGGRGDSFTMAICHDEGDVSIVDCVVEIKPPFNPTEATATMAATLKSYGLHSTVGDRYAAEWVVAAFAGCGIDYKHSDRDRSAAYLDAMPLFTSGRVRLVENKRLINQFSSLERRTAPGGKDRVDHGPGGHDDICNAVALALVTKDRAPLTFHTPLIHSAPRNLPESTDLNKPGGWPAGSPEAAAAAPFSNLSWSLNSRTQ